jgi:hypothetical protein
MSEMKTLWMSVFASAALLAQSSTDWPTGNRTTPPTINEVAPVGVPRGGTVEMTVEGLNLAGASQVYFGEPGIKAKIVRIKELPDLPDIRLGANGTVSSVDLGPLPPRNQITLELDISPDAPIGPVGLRIQTPLGTSPEARFVIEPYYGESPDREPNNTPEEAFETYLPSILVGAISKPGDVDFYKINVKDGDQLVFENAGELLGSSLQPVVGIYDTKQSLVKEFGADGGRDTYAFAHRFEKGGTYFVRISDYEESGSGKHFYRMKVGKFPLVISAFPLGVPQGKTTEVILSGYNLGSGKVQVKGDPSPRDEGAVILRPQAPAGPAFNEVKLALGTTPELLATGTNTAITAAQPLSVPATVNGHIDGPDQYFRFKARKGEKLVLEVEANRLGSNLDSVLEVLSSDGKPIERATIRAVLETSTTLSERDSTAPSARIVSDAGFHVGDYMMIGGEIVRVAAMPKGPDDDFLFESFRGQRIGFLDTTTEAHAVDKPVYKVQIHPPGATFATNGLPLVHLTYRNDDGGPAYGKDSLLHFTAPQDGEYLVRLRDVRGAGGPDFPYRLTVREPRPDFRLSVSPQNPNVPAGGRIPITVTALRIDDFDGLIEVTVEDLPPGLSATKGTVMPGQVNATVLLSAEAGAKLEHAVPLKLIGRAKSGNQLLAHVADPDDTLKLIALAPTPDIVMTAETRNLVLEPGQTGEVTVAIKRNNTFAGRVPIEVRNLPRAIIVSDFGLNGVLINENEDRRTFKIQALDVAQPTEQLIYLSGKIETRAEAQQTSYASEPVVLTVKPKTQVSGSMPASAIGSSAKK